MTINIKSRPLIAAGCVLFGFAAAIILVACSNSDNDARDVPDYTTGATATSLVSTTSSTTTTVPYIETFNLTWTGMSPEAKTDLCRRYLKTLGADSATVGVLASDYGSHWDDVSLFLDQHCVDYY